ncbi:hypothetical protein [Streptomyces canus]|uniref:hypothetical protein n=1 Tax=Streptomyces canus TaxID=58343 RepID=UPI002784EB17|nr:hypothetical protein [Streptomyces canus]MDQ0765901.1 hypothetical protein [Streptomyces canus]
MSTGRRPAATDGTSWSSSAPPRETELLSTASGLAGHRVGTADTGAEAVARLTRDRFGLFVLAARTACRDRRRRATVGLVRGEHTGSQGQSAAVIQAAVGPA